MGECVSAIHVDLVLTGLLEVLDEARDSVGKFD